jgi:hypothetical protein
MRRAKNKKGHILGHPSLSTNDQSMISLSDFQYPTKPPPAKAGGFDQQLKVDHCG